MCAGKVLVVHGGLFSRDDVSLDDIRSIDRFRCVHTDPLWVSSVCRVLCTAHPVRMHPALLVHATL